MLNIKRNLGDHYDYNPLKLMHVDREDLIKEYDRMRRMFQKRVNRLESSDDFNDSDIIQKKQRYERTGRMLTKQELAFILTELEHDLSDERSSLSSLRKIQNKSIETLHERGYKNITKKNYKQFLQYIKATESIALATLKYSYNPRTGRYTGADAGKRMQMFSLAQAKGISTSALVKDFRYFISHIDEIRQLPDRKTGKKLGSKSIRKMLDDRNRG